MTITITPLGKDDFFLRQQAKLFRLPHLAMELKGDHWPDHDSAGDGQLIVLSSPNIRLVSTVFKPGGGRFILKNFEIYYLNLQKKTWLDSILNFIFKEREISRIQIIADIIETIRYSSIELPSKTTRTIPEY